ncbi:MAG: DUF3500 domain-containing protein [Luteitalea sp.]
MRGWRSRPFLPSVLTVLAVVGAGIVLNTVAPGSRAAQGPPPTPADRQARFAKMSTDADTRGLAEPFKGVTTDGAVQPRLFGIRSTGVSTAPVQLAAAAFLASLQEQQRRRTSFPIDDPEWRSWMNQHFYVRKGIAFAEMSAPQREAALALMRASISARGLTLSRDIMRLNHTLGELNGNDFEQYGEGLYWVTVMGTPSATEPWGWQVDGHHLIINYFVLGDQVVMSPTFFGSEPVIATSGKYQGTAILQDEQGQGLALINALGDAQRARAVIRSTKTANDNVGEAWKDNAVVPYVGLPAASLSPAHKQQLLDLIARYVGTMDDGHAAVKMTEVRAHLDKTYFAWAGGIAPDSVFYYRIHSPVILIEFDHQMPVGIRHLVANPRALVREHIHTVIRTPNGNDYGKDLLRQHYAAHAHDRAHGHGAVAPPAAPVPATGPR